MDEKTKEKISLAHKGKKFPKEKYPNYGMRGKHCSKEHKKKIGLGNKGKTCSEKMKENLRKINEGKHCSKETKRKMSISAKNSINKGRFIKGKKPSEETKRKMSLTRKGIKRKPFSKEWKRNMKIARTKIIFPIKDTSIELKIQDFLTLLKIEFMTHKYMNIKNSYQCDIFIPKQIGIVQKIIIECDGDFFHMNPNKFKANDKCFKNGMTAKERWKLDDDRTKELIKKGFKVLRLWEHEINKMELNKFKSILI